MNDLAPLLAFAVPGVKKLIDFVSLVLARKFASATKQAIAWAGGVLIAFVVSWTDYGSSFGLDHLNIWTRVVAGILVGSSASVVADLYSAADNTQSAAYPKLSTALFRGKTTAPATGANPGVDLTVTSSPTATRLGPIEDGATLTSDSGDTIKRQTDYETAAKADAAQVADKPGPKKRGRKPKA